MHDKQSTKKLSLRHGLSYKTGEERCFTLSFPQFEKLFYEPKPRGNQGQFAVFSEDDEARWAGHSPDEAVAKYKALVTESAAREFWSILPATTDTP